MSSQPSSGSDPRQPAAARPYKAPLLAPQDLPVDYSGFIAVLCGVLGVMFRSLANMRNMENDLKQISMAMMFAVMGLVTNYMGQRPPASSAQT